MVILQDKNHRVLKDIFKDSQGKTWIIETDVPELSQVFKFRKAKEGVKEDTNER